ncbi:unnamed protein product [Pleuronectes platessa]|uniref:Uncharacterized protein n=1 Tax=Pleuronectes platessa TaxID=8262 RepID=A0A9N7VCS9_PLEPL|nr:unnamed protein product [Pleuronectes platessa]
MTQSSEQGKGKEEKAAFKAVHVSVRWGPTHRSPNALQGGHHLDDAANHTSRCLAARFGMAAIWELMKRGVSSPDKTCMKEASAPLHFMLDAKTMRPSNAVSPFAPNPLPHPPPSSATQHLFSQRILCVTGSSEKRGKKWERDGCVPSSLLFSILLNGPLFDRK